MDEPRDNTETNASDAPTSEVVTSPVVDEAPAVQPLADIVDGQPRHLSPRSVVVDRLGGVFASILLGVPTLITLIILLITLDVPIIAKVGMSLGWVLFASWLIAGATFYPRLWYNRASYTISPEGIEIRRGVFWRHILNIPRSRVQHTDVRHGPIARHFGIATLIIHTAGTQNHTVTLNGLERDMAMRIRDFLIRGGESDGV